MVRQTVVVLGGDVNDPLEHERAEMADLDVEFVLVNPESEGEAMEAVKEADAIMMRGNWGTEQVIKATEHCKVLAVYSHGFNHIDVDACTEKGIILTNGAGMCAEEVSNQAVTMILALNRQIVQSTNDLRKGIWDGSRYRPIGAIDEQTLGIVGFGNIGRQVARKLGLGWRMETLVFDPYSPPWIMKEYGVEQVFDINELFERSDYISVQVPLNKETYHMIGKEQFERMKPSAFFVNVCRGSVVNEPDLIQALRDKKMRGAGLDVFEQEPADPNNPLFQMENVITAPHTAGQSVRSAWLSRQRASQQVAAALRGDWPTAAQNQEVAPKLEAMTRMRGSAGKVNG